MGAAECLGTGSRPSAGGQPRLRLAIATPPQRPPPPQSLRERRGWPQGGPGTAAPLHLHRDVRHSVLARAVTSLPSPGPGHGPVRGARAHRGLGTTGRGPGSTGEGESDLARSLSGGAPAQAGGYWLGHPPPPRGSPATPRQQLRLFLNERPSLCNHRRGCGKRRRAVSTTGLEHAACSAARWSGGWGSGSGWGGLLVAQSVTRGSEALFPITW